MYNISEHMPCKYSYVLYARVISETFSVRSIYAHLAALGWHLTYPHPLLLLSFLQVLQGVFVVNANAFLRYSWNTLKLFLDDSTLRKFQASSCPTVVMDDGPRIVISLLLPPSGPLPAPRHRKAP